MKFFSPTIFLLFTSINSQSQNCTTANAGPDYSICPVGAGPVVLGTPAIPGLTYNWNPSYGLNNPNLAQPSANPGGTTRYTLTVVNEQAQNLINNGDFENGYNGFSTDYAIFPNSDGSCNGVTSYGSISVSSDPNTLASYWCHMTDHSALGNNMLVVDGSAFANRRIWTTTIAVSPNTFYSFSGWATSLTDGEDWQIANLKFRINNITIQQNYRVPNFQCNGWGLFSMNWYSDQNTIATIEIIDDNSLCAGNDLAIDDLLFSSCPSSTDQVTVCVCGTTTNSETIKVLIPMGTGLQMYKFDPSFGHFCFDGPQTWHSHWNYLNSCGYVNPFMSGFLQADNNLPSKQAFEMEFRMYPKYDGTRSYLDFKENPLHLYDYVLESDILSARLYLFPYLGDLSCDRSLGNLNEFQLTQPHNGDNAYTIKRTTISKNKFYCSKDNSIYNIDNPPTSSIDAIYVPATSNPIADYNIDITQMVKNSLLFNTGYLGFLFQQVQNVNYNNITIQGPINANNDYPSPGDPYIELTYRRRLRSTICDISKTSNSHQPLVLPMLTSNNNEKVQFFPNPTNGTGMLKAKKAIQKVQLFSSQGILLNEIFLPKVTNTSMNFETYTPGIYFCNVIFNSGSEILKIVVTK